MDNATERDKIKQDQTPVRNAMVIGTVERLIEIYEEKFGDRWKAAFEATVSVQL